MKEKLDTKSTVDNSKRLCVGCKVPAEQKHNCIGTWCGCSKPACIFKRSRT